MIHVVLAAGYATRLYPLCEHFPKPLLPVGGKPILDWLLADIDAMPDITAHVVISNHRFLAHFEAWRAQQHTRSPILLLDDGSTENQNRLGAVCDLRFAVQTLGLDDDLLVVAGDNVVDFSFHPFTAFFRQKRASCVMCHPEPDPARQRRTAIVTVDAENRVLTMAEKPQEPLGDLAVPPFYLYTREDARRLGEAIADGCATDAPGSLAAWLAARSALYAWPMPGRRYDIGDMASYQRAQAQYHGIVWESM